MFGTSGTADFHLHWNLFKQQAQKKARKISKGMLLHTYIYSFSEVSALHLSVLEQDQTQQNSS